MLSVLRRDPVLWISALAAAVSAFLVPPSAAVLASVDFRVLSLLFSLMLVVAGLRATGFFDRLVRLLLRFARNTRSLAAILTGACFFCSMFLTNDVSLITFVPLAILLLEKTGHRGLRIPVVVLQTVAANLGSMLTPMGNPQNLYLYSLSGMSAADFLRVMAPAWGVSLLLTAAALFLMVRPYPVSAPKEIPPCRGAWKWLLLFAVCLLAVLRVIHDAAALAAVIAAAVLTDRKLLRRVDYSLLLTFVFLFLFIGNLKQAPAVSAVISRFVSGREFAAGILLSQVISNVPAAMLLSGFTRNYVPLLLGVNIGGLGTLIASMASLISWKLYAAAEDSRPAAYFGVFTAVNAAFLAVLTAAMFLISGG